MPISVGGFLVWLLFPAIVAAAALFPVYAIWRYRLIVARGEGDEVAILRRRFWRLGVGLAFVAYVVIIVGIFTPTIAPALSRFIERGGLAAIVPLILADVALGAIFSRDRAHRLKRG